MATRKTRIMRYRLKVKEIAESKGITQTKLSRLSEMQYDTIHGLWTNDKRDVSLSTLLKLSKALKCDVTDLYELLPDD